MNRDEQFIEQNFGKEKHFLVPDDYFSTFHGRLMERMGESRHVTPKRHRSRMAIRWIACAAACMAVLLVLYGTMLKDADSVPQDGAGVLSVQAENSEPESTPMEQAADYMMIDKDDLYAYIADE